MGQDMSPEEIKKQAEYLRGMGVGQFFIRGVALFGVLCGSYHALKALIALVQQTNNLAAPQHSLNIFALEIPLLALIWAITKLCQEE
jgi:hypothetical protein